MAKVRVSRFSVLLRQRRQSLLLAVLLTAVAAGASCDGDEESPSPTVTGTATVTATPERTVAASPTGTEPDGTTNETVVLAERVNVRIAPGGTFAVLGELHSGDKVRVLGFTYVPSASVSEVWLGVEGLGWVLHDPQALDMPAPLESLAELDASDSRTAAPPHPSDTRTGVEAVDRVIDAVLTGDRDALAALVRTEERPCGPDAQGDDGIPWTCPPGVPEGTPVRKFDISACGGDRGLADQLPVYLGALFDPEHAGYLPEETDRFVPLHLHAVVEVPEGGSVRDDDEYVVYFVYGPGTIARSLVIARDRAISSLGYGCGDPVTLELPGTWPFLLRPYAPPPLSPLP